MSLDRRRFIKGTGGILALPFLESAAFGAGDSSGKVPTRFIVVGNPFGMHPDFFFPKEFGKDAALSKTLGSLDTFFVNQNTYVSDIWSPLSLRSSVARNL